MTGGAGDVSGLDGGLINVAGGLGFRGGRSKQKVYLLTLCFGR